MHGDVWFDLETILLHPSRLSPFTRKLAALLSNRNISAVCGAFSGGAFTAFAIAEQLGLEFLYTERHVVRPSADRKVVDYKLPIELRRAVRDKKVAVVDDVINAGSAAIKTFRELVSLGAYPVVMAALLTVGGPSPKRLDGQYPPIVALEHLESNLWNPSTCPLCASRVPITDPYAEKD